MYQQLREQFDHPPPGQQPPHEGFHQNHYPSCPNFDASVLHELQNAPVPGKPQKEQIHHRQKTAPTFEDLYGGDYASKNDKDVYDYSAADTANEENFYDEIIDYSPCRDDKEAKSKTQPGSNKKGTRNKFHGGGGH